MSSAGKKKKKKKKQESSKAVISEAEQKLEYSSICCLLGDDYAGKDRIIEQLLQITDQRLKGFISTEKILKRIKELQGAGFRFRSDSTLSGLCILSSLHLPLLCAVAILVIDIFHPNFKDYIQVLRQRNCPFVVAANRIDAIFNWREEKDRPFVSTIKNQTKTVQTELNGRIATILSLLAQEGVEVLLYSENKDIGKYPSLVPISTSTGQGIKDLLMVVFQLVQTASPPRAQGMVINAATTDDTRNSPIDVVCIQGNLQVGDTIVACGIHGPIVTTIQQLFPKFFKKHVKGNFEESALVTAPREVKISASQLEKVLTETQIFVAADQDDVKKFTALAMEEFSNFQSRINQSTTASGESVFIQTESVDMIELVLPLLKKKKASIAGVNIGPVTKEVVIKTLKLACPDDDEEQLKIFQELAELPSVLLEIVFTYIQISRVVMVTCHVTVSPDAMEEAKTLGVEIIQTSSLYSLADEASLTKKSTESKAVFPCILQIIPEYIFNNQDPILLECKVLEGIARVETPLCIPDRENLYVGKITGLEKDQKALTIAKRGEIVAVRIEMDQNKPRLTYGRHFDHNHQLYSLITRESIDALKEFHKDDLAIDDWRLVIKLKRIYHII